MKALYLIFFILLFINFYSQTDSVDYTKLNKTIIEAKVPTPVKICRNRISGEFGGKCIGLGANYERLLIKRSRHSLSLSLGFGYTAYYYLPTYYTIPLSAAYNFGTRKSKLYFGAGVTLLQIVDPKLAVPTFGPAQYTFFNQNIGYEWDNKRWFFRIFYANYIYKHPDNMGGDILISPNIGVELGFKF